MLLFLIKGNLVYASDIGSPTGNYPAPRYLKTLVQSSDEELLNAARVVVRQTYGMAGLGRAKPGWTVHVYLPYNQDMDVFHALQQAWSELDVKAIPIQPWEISGETRKEYEAGLEEDNSLLHGYEPYKEIGMFDASYYPYLSEEAKKKQGKGKGVVESLRTFGDYLDKHPEVKHIVRDPGGANAWFCAYSPEHCQKWFANWTYINVLDLVNNSIHFPSDVWNLIEETIAKPVKHVVEGTLTDPEGTNLHWEVSREQAQSWAKYVNLPIANNHMFLYPNAITATVMEGVVAGCANHTGFMPCMKVYLTKTGRVDKVVGGGLTGDYFRELIDHPKFSPENVCFPGVSDCGYWFLSADGFGTNPKKIRNMYSMIQGQLDVPNLWERERGGVQHLSFTGASGMQATNRSVVEAAIKNGDSGVGIFGLDPRLEMYAFENNIPTGHTNHIHNYFPTIKWRLRDTGEWLTISKDGRPVPYDNPEIRALASKYGDVDKIFSYDWIPAIPGINIEGDYDRDYAEDPWQWVMNEWEQIKEGVYPYLVEGYSMLKR